MMERGFIAFSDYTGTADVQFLKNGKYFEARPVRSPVIFKGVLMSSSILSIRRARVPGVLSACVAASCAVAEPLVYEGTQGPGLGRNVVLIASDHEYKSEEALPQLARILARHHGFRCTVLFGLDPATGNITPGESNIPGTEALRDAHLLVLSTRFQNLPDAQMQPIADYLKRGGPVVGLRTSTHAFRIPKDRAFAKFDFAYKGADFTGGFGRQILGETWVGHYGPNHKSSTRLDLVPGRAGHAILAGVTNAWAEIGAYHADPIAGSEVQAMAQPLAGMRPDSPADETRKPVPGVWVRNYSYEGGPSARVFTTTYGASGDLENDGFRRLLVNGCFWAAGLEAAIRPDLETAIVGPYRPSWMKGRTRAAAVKPQDLAGWDTPVWPEESK